MPLQNVISPKLSLLREFHFSTTVQAMYEKLMGVVSPPAHWVVQIAVEADPQQFQTLLRLNIHVKDHYRRFHGGGDQWNEHVPSYLAASEEPTQDMDLATLSAEEKADHIHQVLRLLFSRVKASLYEYDPRIGHSPSRDGPLPACPLLDPGEPLSRMGVFQPALLQRYPSILAEDRIIGTHCPLCEGEIDGGTEFMWGGTNMLWVHVDCWRDA